MFEGRRILAVVPARSGSKGVPGKNIACVGGRSLIAWAAHVLNQMEVLDYRVLSTDDPGYAEEGRAHGLEAPFLRPPRLASDTAGAVETMQHALSEVESRTRRTFDIILIVEPTSPMRRPEDLLGTLGRLVRTGCDSVVTVSPVPTKFHPKKILTLACHSEGEGEDEGEDDDERIGYFEPGGASIVARQQLDSLYYRNGVAYALTRACLMEGGEILGPDTRPLVIDHPVVNIDDPWELEWARVQFEKHGAAALTGADPSGADPTREAS